ncbi:uncharacterized protein [Drosophila virilis]|uniref:uncharacterized protein isoform X1 n=2 Tax=Drosophila virilis TaxID=7244 RepID=UPI00139638D0|nr:uncharacterized protein LOC116650840 [Drosophila virilis]
MYSFGILSKISLLLLMLFVASRLCVLSLPALENSYHCRFMDDCDPFLPICATYSNEHQFFYSHCDMLREICLTGKDWKSDYFSHCNVSKL